MQPSEEKNTEKHKPLPPCGLKGRVVFSIQKFLEIAREVASTSGQFIATCLRKPNEPGSTAVPYINEPLDIAKSKSRQILQVTPPESSAVASKIEESVADLRKAFDEIIRKVSADSQLPKMLPAEVTSTQQAQALSDEARMVLVRTVHERILSMPELTDDERAVLDILSVRFVRSDLPYLIKKDLRNYTQKPSGGFFSAKDLTTVLNTLVEKGFVLVGNDQLNYPALQTFRITLLALEKLGLHPNYKAPFKFDPKKVVGSEEADGQTLVSSDGTFEQILPGVLNRDMDSYGVVYDRDRAAAGYCKTIAVVTANVNKIIASPNGSLHALGFQWAKQERQEAPLCVTLTEDSTTVRFLMGVETTQFEYTQTADCSRGILRRFGPALLLDFRGQHAPHLTLLARNSLPVNIGSIHPLNDGSFACALDPVAYIGIQSFTDPTSPSIAFGEYHDGEFKPQERFSANVLSSILPKGGQDLDEWPCHVNAVFGDREHALIVLSGRNVYAEPAIPGALLLKEGPEIRLLTEIDHSYMSLSVFSSCGEYLATISRDHSHRGIRLTHIASNGDCKSFVLQFDGNEFPRAFVFSPDSKLLGATINLTGEGARGTQVRIWNIEDLEDVKELVSFTRDTDSFPGACVFRSNDSFVFLDNIIGDQYSRAGGTYVNEVRIGHQYVEDRDSFAVSDAFLSDLFIPKSHSEHAFPIMGALRSSEDVVFSCELASAATAMIYRPGTEQLVYGCEDGTIGILSRTPGEAASEENEIVAKLSSSIRSLKISSGGTRILAVTSDGAYALIDIGGEVSSELNVTNSSVTTRTQTIVESTNSDLLVKLAEFGPDEKTIILAGDRIKSRARSAERIDEEADLYPEVETIMSALTSRTKVQIEIHDISRLSGNESLLTSREFNSDAYFHGGSLSPNGMNLVYATNGGTLNMVRLFEGTPEDALPIVHRLWTSEDQIAASNISFNQTGDLLVLDSSVYTLDRDNNLSAERHTDIPFGFSVLHSIDGSGELIALSRRDDSSSRSIVRIIAWKEKDRFGRPRIIAEWESDSEVLSIVFRSDGTELVCTSADGAVRIFGRANSSP